ncbi:hypothetical protein HOG98_07680 [bacterium]|jgi:hypothetical protein|nr:hypothetical protein [bacterium]
MIISVRWEESKNNAGIKMSLMSAMKNSDGKCLVQTDQLLSCLPAQSIADIESMDMAPDVFQHVFDMVLFDMVLFDIKNRNRIEQAMDKMADFLLDSTFVDLLKTHYVDTSVLAIKVIEETLQNLSYHRAPHSIEMSSDIQSTFNITAVGSERRKQVITKLFTELVATCHDVIQGIAPFRNEEESVKFLNRTFTDKLFDSIEMKSILKENEIGDRDADLLKEGVTLFAYRVLVPGTYFPLNFKVGHKASCLLINKLKKIISDAIPNSDSLLNRLTATPTYYSPSIEKSWLILSRNDVARSVSKKIVGAYSDKIRSDHDKLLPTLDSLNKFVSETVIGEKEPSFLLRNFSSIRTILTEGSDQLAFTDDDSSWSDNINRKFIDERVASLIWMGQSLRMYAEQGFAWASYKDGEQARFVALGTKVKRIISMELQKNQIDETRNDSLDKYDESYLNVRLNKKMSQDMKDLIEEVDCFSLELLTNETVSLKRLLEARLLNDAKTFAMKVDGNEASEAFEASCQGYSAESEMGSEIQGLNKIIAENIDTWLPCLSGLDLMYVATIQSGLSDVLNTDGVLDYTKVGRKFCTMYDAAIAEIES